MGDGYFLLAFDLLAQEVIGFYQDLTLFGKAVINLSATYQGWAVSGAMFLLAHRQQEVLGSTNAPAFRSMRMFSAADAACSG